MRKLKKIFHSIVLFVVFSLSVSTTSGNLFAQEKNKGDVSVTFGTNSNSENLPTTVGIIKTIAWRPFSKWISVGASIAIIQFEVPIIANLTLNIPLKWIEPFATAGWGVVIQNLSSVKNYGGGVKIKFTKKVALVVEYRKITITQTNRLHSKHLLELDYVGAGITYYF